MLAGVSAAMGLALLAVGIPRLVAGVYSATAADVVWSLEQNETVPVARLGEAAAALAAANRWSPAAEREALLAFVLIREAEGTPESGARDALYREATARLEAAVTRGPVQPHAWSMLAAMRLRVGDSPDAAAAMRLSMLTGAVVPELMAGRLETALRLLPWMDADTRALLRRQVRLVWVLVPDQIARMATAPAAPGVAELISQALKDLSDDEVAHYLRLHGQK